MWNSGKAGLRSRYLGWWVSSGVLWYLPLCKGSAIRGSSTKRPIMALPSICEVIKRIKAWRGLTCLRIGLMMA